MKISNTRDLSILLGTTLAVAAMASPGASQAATIASKFKANGAAVCQGALPSGAGAVLRARPLAVQNEGASTAFVTCSFPYNDEADEQPTSSMGVRLLNNTGAAVEVSCTLVSGTNPASTNYVVRAAVVPANSAATTIFFYPSDLPGAPTTIFAPNVSCGLLPGMGINYVYYYYDRQIGT